jgi:hypothetical protein
MSNMIIRAIIIMERKEEDPEYSVGFSSLYLVVAVWSLILYFSSREIFKITLGVTVVDSLVLYQFRPSKWTSCGPAL